MYYAAKDKSATLSHKDIVRFFVLAQLSGYFSESTETRLTRTIKELNGSNGTIREALHDLVSAIKSEAKQEYRGLKIKATDVYGSPAKNPLVLLMYIVMRQQYASDFYDSKVTLDEIGPKETQLHHIFPWDFMMKDKRALKMCESSSYTRGEYRAIVNDIANLTFLRQSTNHSIGKQEPAEYLKEISKDIRKAHFIPDDPALWHPERYVGFIDERSRLIADAINRFLRSLE